MFEIFTSHLLYYSHLIFIYYMYRDLLLVLLTVGYKNK